VRALSGSNLPTPREIIDAFNAAIRRALQDGALRDRLLADGAEPAGTTPEAFSSLIRAELMKWARVLKDIKVWRFARSGPAVGPPGRRGRINEERPMRFLKYALIGIGALVFVGGGVLAYVAATFDPNAYKPLIVQMVKEKKNRTLRLDGDIKLAIWPNLGADLGRLSLSEVNSEDEFLAVESARVSLKLIPLLSKQAVVDEVAIKGARAHLVRFKDGRMNIDDLLAKDDRKQEQVGFDIDHVVIENAALGYRDEATGAMPSRTSTSGPDASCRDCRGASIYR
jgi:hypothetical protein